MRESHHSGLAVIAAFKVVKGLLLLLVGAGLLRLAHGEIATFFSLLVEALHLNAHSRLIHALILKVDALQPHGVLMMGILSLSYAGLLLIEGIGLWLEVSWAAYMTVISTSIFLPVEFYEVTRQASLAFGGPAREYGYRGLPDQSTGRTEDALRLACRGCHVVRNV